MNWLGGDRGRPWLVTIAAVAGLLAAIIAVGLVGLLLNQRVGRVTDEALRYDVELEDHGDDLRVAVLDVRHYHRNLFFEHQSTGQLSRGGVEKFEDVYAQLHREIDRLEDLGVRDPDAPQPDEIREMAREYHAGFRPAIRLADTDGAAFERASYLGLMRLSEVESAAARIDKLGEELSSNSLREVHGATRGARLVLLAAIGGLLLVGAVLAHAAVRVVGELRRLYAEQRAASEKLAEASRAKTDFLADVSHELRTPLTMLRGNAEVGLVLDPGWAHRETLDEIVKESGRMTRMVEDLLFLARSDSASLPLERELVAASSFVSKLAGRAEVLARERGAELDAELSADGELEVDQRRVEQAVLILVDNAAKYGPQGGRVRLTSTTGAGKLRVEVIDEGPGIPEEELPRVFERFYRVDKARSRKLGGSGLGLPIAKTIIEAHGGRIEAQSRVGEGTRMSIHLPLIPGTDGKRSEAASSKASARRY